MTVWGAIAGGFAGTLAMTTLLRAASELGLTRIDIPFLLGTAVSVDRTRAKVVGFALHFAAGLLFALLYYASFVAINRSGWWIGAGFGVFHALFAGTTWSTSCCRSFILAWGRRRRQPTRLRFWNHLGSCY